MQRVKRWLLGAPHPNIECKLDELEAVVCAAADEHEQHKHKRHHL